MIRNLTKIGILVVVAMGSMEISSQVINDMVIEVNSKEVTITDAIIQQQLEVAFEEAEKKIEEVMEEEEIVIEVEKVEMKPPLPEPEPEPVVEVAKEETIEVAEEVTTDIITEEVQEEVLEEGNTEVVGLETIDLRQYSELTRDEIIEVGQYLVDHYFLHGYVYYSQEEDPTLKVRKQLAHEMEVYVIQSLEEGFGVIGDLTSINSVLMKTMKEQAILLAEEFKQNYADVVLQGAVYEEIYEGALGYFDLYIGLLEKGQVTFETIEETPNKLLVLPLMLNSINEDLLPGVKEVLEQGFALKEKTNSVYLEGMDDSFLLEPQDVVQIILNPGKVLGLGSEEVEESTEEQEESGEAGEATEGQEESGEAGEATEEQEENEEVEEPTREQEESEKVEDLTEEQEENEEVEEPTEEQEKSEEVEKPTEEQEKSEEVEEPTEEQEESEEVEEPTKEQEEFTEEIQKEE